MYSAPRHLARAAFDPASRAPGIFVADSHRAPLSALLRGVAKRDPFIAILGEAGVGKTTLVNGAVLDQAGAHVRIVRVGNPRGGAFSLADLVAKIAAGDSTAGSEAKRALAALTTEGDARRVVLIVDDAHSLTGEALRYLLKTSDVARDRSVPLQMIFVGRPAFRDVLRQHDPGGRIPISATVEPLSGAEARDYIRRSLSLAGISAEKLLSEATLMAMATHADGIPGRIDALLESTHIARSARGGAAEAADAATWLCDRPGPVAMVLPGGRNGRVPGRAASRIALAGLAGTVILVAGFLVHRRSLPPPAPPRVAVASTGLAPLAVRTRGDQAHEPVPPAVHGEARAPANPVAPAAPSLATRSTRPATRSATLPTGRNEPRYDAIQVKAALGRIRADVLADLRFVGRQVGNPDLPASIMALMQGPGRRGLPTGSPVPPAPPIQRLERQASEPTPPAASRSSDRGPAVPEALRLALLLPRPEPSGAGTWLDAAAMRGGGSTGATIAVPQRPPPVRVKPPEYGSSPPSEAVVARAPGAKTALSEAGQRPPDRTAEAGSARPHPAVVMSPVGLGPVGRLIRQGDAMLVAGDVPAARPFYERAAAARSGAAATRLGKTYDPSFLAAIEADNVAADRSMAAVWYRRAIALGDGEARDRLNRLNVRMSE